MPSASETSRLWSTFRRVFLWTLAACALLWSFRADADDGPQMLDPSTPPAVQPAPQPSADLPPMPAEPVAPRELEQTSATAQLGASVTHFPAEDWTVTISPRQPSTATINGRRYSEVYASIPYSEAEYLANPGYRHEATMEVMFGHLRPKTTVSEYQPRTVPKPYYTPYKPYRYSQTELQRWYPSSAPFSFGFPIGAYYPAYPRLPMLY